MFNSFIIRLFRVSMKLLSVLFFNVPKIFKVLKFNEKNRFYRSILIRQTVLLLKKILKSLNYNLPITISKDKVIVEVDGVLIVTDKINRYFKISGNDKYYNQASVIGKLATNIKYIHFILRIHMKLDILCTTLLFIELLINYFYDFFL